MHTIMEVRGFPPLWCDWVDFILNSCRSAVLLNGVSGRWFSVKNGLCQGDPSFPDMFLIADDVLQQLIHQNGVTRRRWWFSSTLSDALAVVLQYGDDTLIVMQAVVDGAARLHLIMDQFAEATKLVINFTKSTLITVHVEPVVRGRIVVALGVRGGCFPSVVLRAPPVVGEASLGDFLSMIVKVDKYLAGWAVRLLTPAGRLVLINAVLDALPAYAMAALLLPPVVLRALDGLHRSFLWNVAERISGVQCLVAWERLHGIISCTQMQPKLSRKSKLIRSLLQLLSAGDTRRERTPHL
ncbi:hypothetical protein D1007_18093 [Hordeum vulgare]|nr:hypothetical protein D1007_18093 [Hordeum vulgare]